MNTPQLAIWREKVLMKLTGTFLQGLKHPVFFGKLARIDLGVNELTIYSQLKAATPGGNQIQTLDLLFQCGKNLVR